MPTPPLSEETMRAALEAVAKYGSVSEAARQLDINRKTLSDRVSQARQKGIAAVEAAAQEMEEAVSEFHHAAGAVPISQDESKIQTATREEIIDEILRVVEQDTTKVITRNHFRNESRYAESAWLSHFGTFEEAKRQAGVTLSRHAHRLGLNIAKHASVDTMRGLNEQRKGWEGKYLRPSSRRFQTVLVCSDVHDINCDPFYRRLLMDTAARAQPEKIVLNGDIFDAPEFSKHTQDPRSFLLLERIRWVHTFLGDLREAAPDAEMIFTEGNHELRLLRHMGEQTPAMMVVLADLHGFDVAKLLGLDRFGINYIARADITAWTERDIAAQLRKNYATLYDNSLLFGHYPEMRNMGIPGSSGHHHKHIVWPFYSPTYGPSEWHQIGSGHTREASYCAGEKWGLGFLLAHCDTHSKRTQFEYIDVSHPHAVVGGKFYERTADEPIKDLLS